MRDYHSIEEAIREIFGNTVVVQNTSRISGGDINETSCLFLSNGAKLFLKTNRSKDKAFFISEMEGLAAIKRTGTISVPETCCAGYDLKAGAFLLMEYVENARKVPDFWARFAADLCKMHSADAFSFVSGGRFGFLKDNFIGSREQDNTPTDGWVDFFRDRRLVPRFKAAKSYFDEAMKRKVDNLLGHLDKWLIEPKEPSLLHGDLWGGNFIVGSDGRAWLIDPAVYVGHAEADLAMTELFGGFSDIFYREYLRLAGFEPGYEDRREIYNLYHLLNHLISFGASYLGAVRRIVDHFAG